MHLSVNGLIIINAHMPPMIRQGKDMIFFPCDEIKMYFLTFKGRNKEGLSAPSAILLLHGTEKCY